MRVRNKIQVMLELQPVVGCQYCLNNQELYTQCNNVYLCRIYQLRELL